MWPAVTVAVVVAAALVLLMMRDSESFPVGASREVTVMTGSCWRASVGVADTSWDSPSSEPVPSAWGTGTEVGTLTRISDVEAVFTSAADGQTTTLFGGEGEVFSDTACPLGGRASG